MKLKVSFMPASPPLMLTILPDQSYRPRPFLTTHGKRL